MTDIKERGDQMEEACGVFGIYAQDESINVAEAAYYGLFALQHRGQESAGIAVADGKGIKHYRNLGLVPEVFDEEILHGLTGRVSIGHVRYSTFGSKDVINSQPLVARCKIGMLALAHNGNLVNADALRAQMEDDGAIFQTSVDTEVILNLIARESSKGLIEAVRSMMEKVRGSYALVLLAKDKLIGIRDPYGIRPLCLGRVGNSFVLASESCALDAVGAEFVRDVQPGEIVVIDAEGIHSMHVKTPMRSRLCLFEFVYFARPDSVIDGINVYQSRVEAGKRLAIDDDVEADMVIGVPDSALAAAMGYAQQSGIPYGDGLAKNRYVGRTFIQPEQGMRELGVRTKLNALTRNVRGKRLILVDDSIVRGTTSRKIVEMLRTAGAKEVHMRISSPSVLNPCYFGIDTATSEELIGHSRSAEEICRFIGADSLKFLSLPDLLKTVAGSGCQFCTGCFDGDYPIDPETGEMHGMEAAKARPGGAAARVGLPLRGRAADSRGADGVRAGQHERGRGAGHDAGAAGAAVVGAVRAVCGCAGRAVRDAALHPGVSGWFPFHRRGEDVRGVCLTPVPDGYGVSPPVRGGGSGAGAGAVRAGGRIEGGRAGGGAAV